MDGSGERLHRRHRQHACAQGKCRRDDHHDRRHRRAGLFRGRRPGHRGAAALPGRGRSGRTGKRLHRRSRKPPRSESHPSGTIRTFAGTGANGFSETAVRHFGAASTPAWSRARRARERLHRRRELARAQSEHRRDDLDARRRWTGLSGEGGPATAAQLCCVWGVAVDGRGNVYFSEGSRVRKVTASTQALTLTLASAPLQPLLAQEGITITAKCNRPCSLAATGSVTILGTKHVFRLSRATAKLAAGKRTLRLQCSAAEQQRFRKLLENGQQARAVITVQAKDKAGNTSTSKRTVAVR